MTTQAVDNGSSFAGRYGLSNPTVIWLIGRGFGELGLKGLQRSA